MTTYRQPEPPEDAREGDVWVQTPRIRRHRRVGPIGILFAPGYGWCARCRTPWKFVDGVVIHPHPGKGHGYFALCGRCWDACDADERIRYYERERQRVWALEVGEDALRIAVLNASVAGAAD